MVFEHVANARCLELANSVPDRNDGDRDWLADAETADAWAATLGLGRVEPLTGPDRAALIDLREAIFAVFGAHVQGAPIDPRALGALTREHTRGLGRHGYVAEGSAFRRDWPVVWDGPSLRAAFAGSAVELLTDPRLDRVGQCPSCGWLFVDTTKNRSRRWCSMEMCGGRDKALRHYRRQRAGASD